MKLFINYAVADHWQLKDIADILRDGGHDPWFDIRLLPGQDKAQTMADQIELCDAFVYLLSKESVSANWCKWAFARAVHAAKPIMPILIRPNTLIPEALQSLQPADFTRGIETANVARLIAGINKSMIIPPEKVPLLEPPIGVPDQVLSEEEFESQRDVLQSSNNEDDMKRIYLSDLVNELGLIPFSAITDDKEYVDSVLIEDVYIDLLSDKSLGVKIENNKIVDWWIDTALRRDMNFQLNSITIPGAGGVDYDSRQTFLYEILNRPQKLEELRLTDKEVIDNIVQKEQVYLQDEHLFGKVSDGVYRSYCSLSLKDLVAASKYSVIVGGPGSGKTTFLKHLAMCMIGEQLELDQRGINLSKQPSWTHGSLTPIYIKLPRFFSLFLPNENDNPEAINLLEYIGRVLLRDENRRCQSFLEQELLAGKAILLFDGLDEIPYLEGSDALVKRQRQLQSLFQIVANVYSNTRIVVTCRPNSHNGWELPGFAYISINPLDQNLAIELMTRVHMILGNKGVAHISLEEYIEKQRSIDWKRQQEQNQELKDAIESLGKFLVKDGAEKLTRELENLALEVVQSTFSKSGKFRASRQLPQIRDVSELFQLINTLSVELKSNPLFITLFSILFFSRRLKNFDNKAQVYFESIYLLLERWTQQRFERSQIARILNNVDRDTFIRNLSQIAFESYRLSLAKSSVVSQIFTSVDIFAGLDPRILPGTSQLLDNIPPELIASRLMDVGWDTGINPLELLDYISRNAGVIEVLTHTKTERVFAFAHRSFQEFLSAVYIFQQCGKSYDTVCKYLSTPEWRSVIEYFPDIVEYLGNKRDLWKLIEDTLQYSDSTESENAILRPLAFSAKIILEKKLVSEKNSVSERAILDHTYKGLEIFSKNPTALEYDDRVFCGRLLGAMGDRREGVLCNNQNAPDFTWVEIPSGEYMGLDGKAKYVDTFFITKYPITFAQYYPFGNDVDIEEQAKKHFPLPIMQIGYPKSSRPSEHFKNEILVGITWWEVWLYCIWLKQKSGIKARLPTYDEWLKASESKDRLLNLGIIDNKERGKTTIPVGLKPETMSKYGVMDMGDSVWDMIDNEPMQDLNSFDLKDWLRLFIQEAKIIRIHKSTLEISGWPRGNINSGYVGFHLVCSDPDPKMRLSSL